MGSLRRQGMEWRAARWLGQHPGITGASAALGAGMIELGPTTLGTTLAGLGVGAVSWYRAHPDSFDAYASPWLRAQRRRWVRYVGWRWRNIMADVGLARDNRRTGELEVPRLLRVRSASPSIDTLILKPLRGQSLRAFQDRQEELSLALKADAIGIVKVRPNVLAITVVRGNPFERVVEAPPIPEGADAVDLTALTLGEDEYGNPWQEPLLGNHWLGVGEAGSGKGSLLWSPLRQMGPAIREGLVKVTMCDLKGGMETELARPLFDRYRVEPTEAKDAIQAFRDDMKATQARLAESGKRKVTVSTETPLHVLMIDEMAMMTALASRQVTTEAVKLLTEIMQQGRAPGFAVCSYIQEPTKDVLPMRDLYTRRFLLRASVAGHVDMVLGEGARVKGALADEIPAGEDFAGIGYRVDNRTRQPRRVRASYVSDDDIRELVDTCTPPTPADSNVTPLHREADTAA